MEDKDTQFKVFICKNGKNNNTPPIVRVACVLLCRPCRERKGRTLGMRHAFAS